MATCPTRIWRKRNASPDARPGGRPGLTLSGVVWAFGLHFANWHPLTWISYFLDAQLFGMKAGGFHLVNLLLHMASTALLFLALFLALLPGYLLRMLRRGGYREKFGQRFGRAQDCGPHDGGGGANVTSHTWPLSSVICSVACGPDRLTSVFNVPEISVLSVCWPPQP